MAEQTMIPFQKLLDRYEVTDPIAALWRDWCAVAAQASDARCRGDHQSAETATLAARGIALVGASLPANVIDDVAPKTMWLAYYRDVDVTSSTWMMIAAAIRFDNARLQPGLIEALA